jgi:hypothetical protein
MSIVEYVFVFVFLSMGLAFLMTVAYMLFEAYKEHRHVLFEMYRAYRRKWLMRSVIDLIRKSKMKLTNQDRFIVSYEMLKKRFSQYDDYDMYMVFCELVEQGYIKRDPSDGEYILC